MRIPDETEVFQAKEVTQDKSWCLDSGCTFHLCSDSNKFTHLVKITDNKLNLANNSSMMGKGTVRLETEVDGNSNRVNLKNILHVSDLRTNLLSVSKITDREFKIIFEKESARTIDRGITKLAANRIDGLYYLQEDKYDCRAAVINKFDRTFTKSSMEIWHRKMGHLNIGDH